MKHESCKWITALLITGLTLVGQAQDDRPGPDDRAARKARLLEKFDANGDGVLDAEEMAKAKKELEKRRSRGKEKNRRPALSREQILEKFDANGNGKIDPEEREKVQAALKARRGQRGQGGARRGDRRPGDQPRGRRPGFKRPSRQELMERFDKDGDGKLDEAERTQAKRALRKMLQERKRSRQGLDRRPGNQGPSGRRGPNRDRRPQLDREQILERFDTNGNGKIDPEEREKVKAAMKARRGQGRRGGGLDDRRGDDRPQGNRRRGNQSRRMRQGLLKEFDANGDGVLDEEERRKARAARAERGDAPPRDRGKNPHPDRPRSEMLEKYDANGDGELDREERRKAMEESMERRRRGHGDEPEDR